jgi:hypothetical protein
LKVRAHGEANSLEKMIGGGWWFAGEILAFIDEGNNRAIPTGVDQKRVIMKTKRLR